MIFIIFTIKLKLYIASGSAPPPPPPKNPGAHLRKSIYDYDSLSQTQKIKIITQACQEKSTFVHYYNRVNTVQPTNVIMTGNYSVFKHTVSSNTRVLAGDQQITACG
jgi:hypothetical protein